MRDASAGSGALLASPEASMRTALSPTRAMSAPRSTHGFQQCLDVADPGQVLENDGSRHEERGGDDGERLVLVAGRPDRALDGTPAFHRELIAGKRLDEHGHEPMLPAERAWNRQQLVATRSLPDAWGPSSAGAEGSVP